MLVEYAILPDVFSPSTYDSPEASKHHLSLLKDAIRSRGLVRNLHAGSWLRFVQENRDRWDMSRIKELLKVILRDRLCDSAACGEAVPSTATEWCQEALESHLVSPLQGIIADQPTADLHKDENLIAAATQLTEKTWWLGGKNSIELKRSTDDYLQALGPTLKHSKSIMFVDPHLDPTRPDYRSIVELLKACGTRTLAHRIEIHRVCFSGSGIDRNVNVPLAEWEERFKSRLGQIIQQMGLHVEVFLWDDFHDRYLISNLIGILMPNGFDTDARMSVTRWARLDRDHRDSVEKEFDPESSRHKLRHRFSI